MPPPGFSWVDPPRLAALARPQSVEDLRWLRRNGIDVLVSLTESPVPRQWVNEVGMLAVAVPVPDMAAPTDRQLDHVLATIRKANAGQSGGCRPRQYEGRARQPRLVIWRQHLLRLP